VVWFGGITQTVGAWLRYAGKGKNDFWLLILGSSVAGPALACFISTPSVLAAIWFAENQRSTAVAIGSLSGVLGLLIAFVLGPAIVNTESDIPIFLLVQAIIPTVAVLFVFLFKKEPSIPPSLATTVDKTPLLQSLKEVFTNTPFVLLLVFFSLGLGVFNALTTVVDQLVNPFGYNTDVAGLLGVLLIALGLVGAGIFSFAVERTRKFKIFTMISVWMLIFSFIWMTTALKPNNLASLSASWAFLGFFALPLLPLTLEFGVELTFPVPEVVTNGILMLFGQIFGVVFTFVIDAIQQPGANFQQNTRYGCWFMFALMVVAGIFISLLTPNYKRMAYEMQHNTQKKWAPEESKWKFFL